MPSLPGPHAWLCFSLVCCLRNPFILLFLLPLLLPLLHAFTARIAILFCLLMMLDLNMSSIRRILKVLFSSTWLARQQILSVRLTSWLSLVHTHKRIERRIKGWWRTCARQIHSISGQTRNEMKEIYFRDYHEMMMLFIDSVSSHFSCLFTLLVLMLTDYRTFCCQKFWWKQEMCINNRNIFTDTRQDGTAGIKYNSRVNLFESSLMALVIPFLSFPFHSIPFDQVLQLFLVQLLYLSHPLLESLILWVLNRTRQSVE